MVAAHYGGEPGGPTGAKSNTMHTMASIAQEK